jgi:DeoR/GlpR family transcriptional regulator of sugar metabolism
VATVSEALEVSEATTRRLFSRLEEEGKVLRLHGGVQIAPSIGHGYSYHLSAHERIREKTGIGQAAAEIIQPGERVFLDSGTTVLRCAEALSIRLQTGELRDVVVLTNSLTYTGLLASQCRVMLIGGEIRPNRNDVCGSLAERNLEEFHVDRAFFGADAISIEYGYMATDERTSRMNEIIVARADTFYVLSDSSKFGRRSFVSYATIDSATALVTDSHLAPENRASLVEAGVAIVTAEL